MRVTRHSPDARSSRCRYSRTACRTIASRGWPRSASNPTSVFSNAFSASHPIRASSRMTFDRATVWGAPRGSRRCRRSSMASSKSASRSSSKLTPNDFEPMPQRCSLQPIKAMSDDSLITETVSIPTHVAGGLDPDAVAALHSDGATLADAVALYRALENPEEVLGNVE